MSRPPPIPYSLSFESARARVLEYICSSDVSVTHSSVGIILIFFSFRSIQKIVGEGIMSQLMGHLLRPYFY